MSNSSGNSNKTAGNKTAETEESKYQKYVNLAGELDLNTEEFARCMDEYDTSEVQADISYALSIGANGTPAFYLGKNTSSGTIRGIPILGAVPYQYFSGMMDAVLASDDRAILEIQARLRGATEETMEEMVTGMNLEDMYVDVELDDDPVSGNADAPLVLVDFSDYECPFCQRHYMSAYGQIKDNYVKTGKLKYVYRDLVVIDSHMPNAMGEAVAANCARAQGGDEAYFSYHDKVFEKTKSNGLGFTL